MLIFYLLSQPPGFSLRLQEGQHITLSNWALDITDDWSVAIIHEFDPYLWKEWENINMKTVKYYHFKYSYTESPRAITVISSVLPEYTVPGNQFFPELWLPKMIENTL